jgi:hypothetical protein
MHVGIGASLIIITVLLLIVYNPGFRRFTGIASLFFVGIVAVAILGVIVSKNSDDWRSPPPKVETKFDDEKITLNPEHFDVRPNPEMRSKWPYKEPPCSGGITEAYVATHFVDYPPPSQFAPCVVVNSHGTVSYDVGDKR